MNITIDYDQGKFIRDHAVARIKAAELVLTPDYRHHFLNHMPSAHYKQAIEERRAEIDMLLALIDTVCEYCDYEVDGTDTDGTIWYRCKVHDETAPMVEAPCAGYVGRPYLPNHKEHRV
jgi:hypothetical protein